MLPPISAVTSIEMIRDGGSLNAGFIGSNGSKYALHFALISKYNSSGGLMRLGYEQPVFFERLEIREENRFGWEAINQVEISWMHAKIFLYQLRSFLQSDEDSKWLEAMEEVANTEGKIPSNMQRVLEPVHLL
jgi:hypothetical protein